MRQLVTIVTAYAVIGVLLLITASAAARGDRLTTRESATGAADSSLIVAYKHGTGAEVATATEATVGGRRTHAFKSGAKVLKVAAGKAQETIAKLRKSPHVRYAEPDYTIATTAGPDDALYGYQWPLKNVSNPGHDIGAEAAWSMTTGSSSIVVGVLDSGIDYTHPDLAANVWSNPGGIGGCPAGTHGYNFAYGSCDPLDDERVSHGTAVSGVIGAVGGNGIGVTGVNQSVKVMGLKIANSSGTGAVSAGIAAIDWAIRAKQAGVNIRVLNNSWGFSGGWSQALRDEIELANTNGILFVAAAGNGSVDIGASPFYPCAMDAPNMVCVGATDSQDNLAAFSNRGAGVDLAAPGVGIASTKIWSQSAGGGLGYPEQGYSLWSGTSLASPFVAGAAALILSRENLSTGALRSRLLATVDPIPSLAGLVATGGRLNLARAVAGDGGGAPSPTPTPTSTTEPTSEPGATPDPGASSDPTPAPTETPTPTATPEAPGADPTAPPTPTPAPSQAPSKPGAPTLSVALTTQTQGSGVNLTWVVSADGGAPLTGYRVYRGTRAGSEKLLVSVGPDAGYEDTSALPGTKYFYRTSAINAAGEGPKSNTVSATIPMAPTAPRSLKVAVVSTGGLKLTWSAPSKAGTSPITGYWIWRGDAAGGETQLVQVGTARSYIDLTTTPGVKAWYVVTAINAVGESPRSNEVGATPAK